MTELRDRLTVVCSVYHQPFGEQPQAFESRFSRALRSNEQPYDHRLTVGSEWVPLDCGWIHDAGMLLLFNEAGRNLRQYPSEEEQQRLAEQVIELRYINQPDGWLIPPGESLRAYPAASDRLEIRCRGEAALIRIVAVPR